jgi:AraC family transcriptional regulator, regulatory protein of adaptative response / DNA-3-methyladenine glycosylase II
MNDDTCYAAMQSRDARFDGAFFVGVTSTGIYCRPICKVRIPKRENCRFFTHAAVAEGLGFRACLRCRPNLAPTDTAIGWTNEDASKTLAQQALQLIDRSGGELSVVQVATKMGISDRHLRRIFAAQWGLTPQAYSKALTTPKPLLLQFPFHAPYDHAHMLKFFATRAIEGVEHVDEKNRLWRAIRLGIGRKTHTGWICVDFSVIGLQAKRDKARASANLVSTLPVTISASLTPVLAQLVPLLRAAFDLDAQPTAIDTLLLPDFPNTQGQRVPGCFDGFELTVRAILGQQITVQAARTLALRLVTRFGEPLKNVEVPVNRLFPSAAALARASASDLGELGIVRGRQAAILGLAVAVQNGLDLSSKPRTPTELQTTRDGLRAIKGIGEWTAAYVAMRALRDPDSFPAGDVALQNALGISLKDRQASPTKSAKDAEAQSAKWQPWRSYAVLRAWQRLEKSNAKQTSKEQI